MSGERLCEQCEERPIPPKHEHYCDNVCRGLARSYEKGRQVAPTPFARFIDRKNRSLRITHNAFARLVGVSPATVTRWRQGKAVPVVDALARLRDLFGDEVPVLDETGTDRKGKQARKNLVALNGGDWADKQREGARKGGHAGKGKAKPEHSEKMRAWHASDAAAERRRQLSEETGPRLTANVKSDGGRAAISLGQILRHNIHLHDAKSDVEKRAVVAELRAHADCVAEGLSLTGEAVWAQWKGPLRARGLPAGAGRPENTAVWEAVDDLRGAGVTWSQVCEEVGYLPEQVETLQRGHRRWRERRGHA